MAVAAALMSKSSISPGSDSHYVHVRQCVGTSLLVIEGRHNPIASRSFENQKAKGKKKTEPSKQSKRLQPVLFPPVFQLLLPLRLFLADCESGS